MESDVSRILCVDDEPNVLQGLERTLYEHFDVSTALSGQEGLDLIAEDGPFAVIVSDMRMPRMDGATFLSHARKLEPDTVRVLLTGHSEVESAIKAVNEGHIFRFLAKPCPSDTLIDSLQAGVRQYRLVRAERELLENTLNGSVKVLADVLSLAAPVAFSRSSVIKSYVVHMADKLEVENRWQFEVAAMLSQIGCIALPPDTLDKVYAGQAVSEDEQRMLDEHPETAHKLLAPIPRFAPVAEMIRLQADKTVDPGSGDAVHVGAAMLRLALDIDRQVTRGSEVATVVAKLQRGGGHDAQLVDAMASFHADDRTDVIKAVLLRELRSFMVLDEDIRTKSGNVVVGRGYEVNHALIERLKNFARGVGVVEPIRVRVPQ